MKDEIINLCKEIKGHNKCSSCSGNFDNYTCIYCGNVDGLLKDLEDKLINYLNSSITLDEDILMSLYSIKSLNINVVNNILSANNYEDVFNNKYSDICNRIDDNGLENDDYGYILYLIENGFIEKDKTNMFVNILMKAMLLNKLDILNDKKIVLIKNFTEMIMEARVANPKCVFEKLDDNTLGESFFNVISLDVNDINNLLDNESYIKLLELIWHECTHAYQRYIMLVDKNVSYSNLLHTKEEILSDLIPGYYNENYHMFSSEVEARYMGAYLTLEYLNILNLELGSNDYFISVMNREEQLFMNQNRVVAGKDTTVDELFLSLDNGMELLDRYPVLGVEFKVQGNAFVKKSMEELMNDYDNYKNGSLKLNGKNEDIEFLYNYLIENAKRYKERS